MAVTFTVAIYNKHPLKSPWDRKPFVVWYGENGHLRIDGCRFFVCTHYCRLLGCYNIGTLMHRLFMFLMVLPRDALSHILYREGGGG